HEAFWELTSRRFHRNSEVKRVRTRAIPGWVTHLEVLVCIPRNKSMRAWSGPKADNIVLGWSRAWDVMGAQVGMCIGEDVGPLRVMDSRGILRAHLFRFHRNSEVKRVHARKQNHEGVVGAQSGQYRAMAKSSLRCGGGSDRDVTINSQGLLELTGHRFHRNSEVKRVRTRAIPGWVTHLEVLKQKHEGIVGAQSGQYRVMIELNLRCDGGPGRDHEAFWEFTGFRFHRNYEVKRVHARAIP
ncbi:hypothetical protein DVH24_016797, partial [Malus domestica]